MDNEEAASLLYRLSTWRPNRWQAVGIALMVAGAIGTIAVALGMK